jgi:benzoylformate decarboxylase
VIGEGSVQYAVTGFWTAAAYRVPVTFLVLQNREYGILKWFAMAEQVQGVPGLDLPELDCAAIAQSYGVRSAKAAGREQLRAELSEALGAEEPRLVEVSVEPGMSLY